jgi:Beta-lactamase superfamily domain
MLDGGGAARPRMAVSAWLVTDERAELASEIRRLGRAWGVEPEVGAWHSAGMRIRPLPVAHTSHPTYGYLIESGGRRIAWAPEFWEFPTWATGVDIMFADAAGWRHPIRFARGVGGHASVFDTAATADRLGVKRLVFAHIGRPSIRAQDSGLEPPFGEWGWDRRTYRLTIHSALSGGPLTAGPLPTDVFSAPPEGGGWPV